MARKNSIISANVTDAGVTFTVEGIGDFAIAFDGLSDEIRNRAMVHGLVQKVSDGAAIPKAETDGLSADAVAEKKFNAMQAIATRLLAGDWSKRSGDGSGANPAGLIFRAFYQFAVEMAKAKKKPAPTEESVRAVYDAKTRSEQLAFRSIPRVAEIMDEMRAKSGSAIDADSLLGEIGL